jgi:translation elongation factor EF-Ts
MKGIYWIVVKFADNKRLRSYLDGNGMWNAKETLARRYEDVDEAIETARKMKCIVYTKFD